MIHQLVHGSSRFFLSSAMNDRGPWCQSALHRSMLWSCVYFREWFDNDLV
jgi:hypothetical protein